MTNNKQQTEINAVEYLDKVNQFAKENNTGKPRQQTAVEWLYNELLNAEPNVLEWNKLLEHAKEMEKERMIKAYNEDLYGGLSGHRKFNDGEDYYNETYGGGDK